MHRKTHSARIVFAIGIALTGVQFVKAASVDLDGDGTVSASDYRDFQLCFHGANVPVNDAPCADAHFDADTDIDLVDFSKFQLRFHPGKLGNFCDSPIDASDGTLEFSTIGATTDGPDEPVTCLFFTNSQVSNDVWFCYTATCNSEDAAVSLCGSDYDTKLAVYDGCGCPTEPSAIACNDDGCGSDIANVQSRVAVSMVAGHQYLIRVGGYVGATGDGILTIRCGNAETCTPDAGDCFTGHAQAGCNNSTCCHETCDLDQFCCDVVWDTFCAGEAVGVCTGNYASCSPTAGNCDEAHTNPATPGCNNTSCCNSVCQSDPYCCLTAWDADCVGEANGTCFLTCTPQAGDCFSGHGTPGCNDASCCQKVCGPDPFFGDIFCCDTTWDAQCAGEAAGLCGQ